MSRVVDGLQGEYREEEDPAQGHGHDHGRGQQVHPFWSEEVQEEHLLAQARPRGLPDETLSENLLELDLDEDELRTAGESTPPSWEPLENQGRSQSDAVGSQSVQDGLRVLRPEGLQGVLVMGSQGIPGCSHCWRLTWQKVELACGKGVPAWGYLDFKDMLDKDGVLDKFKALRWNN